MRPTPPAPPRTETLTSDPLFRGPFEATAAERAALKPADLLVVNIDIPLAVTTCLGALPQIATLIDDVRTHLPTVDADRLARVETYARACGHAHARYIAATNPTDMTPELDARAITQRDELLDVAELLARRNALPRARVREIRASGGPRKHAFDLLAVVDLFRENWDKVHDSVPIGPADLGAAEATASDLLTAIGRRERAANEASDASVDRQRAFTLFIRVYDELRRAAMFLRWHTGDADRVVPSVYVRNTRRRRDAAAQPAQPDAHAPQPAPTPDDASVAHPAPDAHAPDDDATDQRDPR